jgi:diguanylate cyclase (GGDEF)-like protein
MSFRNRLTLFFVAIVIAPMLSVAFVLFSLIADNETGKADAALAARQGLAVNLYRADVEQAGELAGRIGADRELADALRAGDDAAATRRADALLAELGAVRIRIEDRRGERVDVGRPDAIAPARRELVEDGGTRFGRLEVSDRSAPVFARTVRRLAGVDAVVRQGDRTLGATRDDLPDGALPAVGDATVGGQEVRIASFPVEGFAGQAARVSLLDGQEAVRADVARSRLFAIGIIGGFFALAIVCAFIVSRSLQTLIAGFLDAARRIGRGDFSVTVPTHGRDELAALGDEFNQMARQLEERLEELRTERQRVERSMRRLGEAFGSNLDRGALLEIAVTTVVEAVGADGGRGTLTRGDRSASGALPDGVEPAVAQAEGEALASGERREVLVADGAVLAHPLPSASGGAPFGVLAAWRRERPFDAEERERFHYLAGQAAVSLDNVTLHETVRRQAVTDELTGLANHRRFQEVLSSEVERARRFESTVGLVMLDIDNFKAVNDRFGHQVGDRVLAGVAHVLREVSREIDEPARYGGEELAVVLPGTDLEGAHNLAERVRAGIEALRFELGEGREPLGVTASFGAASLPESAGEQGRLIAAADAALYAAKRSGKNRTVRAEPEPTGRGQ